MAPTYTTPSTKYGLHRVDGSTNVSDVDEAINQLADDVDATMAGYAQGTLTARAGVTATAGKLYRTTDTGQLFMGTGSAWIEIGVSPWVPGDLKWSWLTTDHAGWLLCDGRITISRSTYAALFTAIGTSVSVGDGSTTFGIPDWRGRTIVMPDGSAGRLADNDARGQGVGLDYFTMSTVHLPPHKHRQVVTDQAFASGTAAISVPTEATNFNNNPHLADSFMEATGSASPMDNRMPYLVAGGVFIRTT